MIATNNAKKNIEEINRIKNKSLGIPVTIISGFLGSGKTTLLNHILSSQKELKAAVLVNEFGEIGIDNELIVRTGEEIIELSNGCICCTINGDLLESIKNILNKNNDIEYLIIETTGLADPLPVAMTINDFRGQLRLDSIITLIDSDNFNEDIMHSQIARSQIIYGDILLLNKCDLVSKEKLSNIELELSKIKTDPRILYSVKGNVPLELLLSVGLFQTDLIAKKQINKKLRHDHEHSHDHDHGHHDHEKSIEGFTSLSFTTDSPFSLRKFQSFLDNQLPSNIFRAKGILWFKESELRHIFHLSGKRFSIDDSDWQGTKKNQLVLIGKEIKHDEIKSQLEKCISKN